ncbi:hypothetical protein IWW50_006480, partial [Coemansia erecta]
MLATAGRAPLRSATAPLRSSIAPLRSSIAHQRHVHSTACPQDSDKPAAAQSDEGKKTLPQKASHIVRSILHGSEQVRQETKDTLSKVLARGKYVHELATHNVRAGGMDAYKAVVGELYPRIVRNQGPGVKLVGSWETDVGELDTAVHIWEYQGYPALSAAYATYREDAEYRRLHAEMLKLVRARRSQ